jgi:NodT family efflux transporter outer membrane factor (OMF) lipoprotein
LVSILAARVPRKHQRAIHIVRAAVVPVAAVLLWGCAVGPDFERPAAPANAGFAPNPLPPVTVAAAANAGAAQHFLPGQDVPFDWWKTFQCPALNSLVERALRANPTIEAAKAALRQAHELTLSGEGAFFPTVQGGFAASRNKSPASLSPVTSGTELYYSLYTPQVSVSYAPDVFGGTRRTVESLQAQEDTQRFETEAAYITLASNVVVAAIMEASTRAQIVATNDIIDVERKSLDILRNQQKYGYAMAIDAAAQEAALAAVEQTLPPLEKQLELTRDLLRALAGNMPNEDAKETFTLACLHLPEDLPVSLPSSIVEQRPDVRAAEAQLHAASADVGIAVAAMLPQVTLTGNVGTTALTLATLSAPGNVFWIAAGSVAQTLFDGGALLHKKRAAEEALVATAAQYRSTVIAAFQNVADTLHAIIEDANALKAAVLAEHAAKVTLDMTLKQQQVGYVNYLTLLQAEQAYQTAEINLVQAQTARLDDTAALFQALGGGWWNRKEVAMRDTEGENRDTAASLHP